MDEKKEEEQEVGDEGDQLEIRLPSLSQEKVILLMMITLVVVLSFAVLYYIDGYNELVVFHNEFVNETREMCPLMFMKYQGLPMVNLGNLSGINLGEIG